jgi:hypothetical protein
MKSKLNVILAVTILGILGSAYGTCYLNRVVLCVGNGNTAASFSKTCAGSGTVTFSYAVIADEAAYKFDAYSVTLGGLKTQDWNVVDAGGFFCDGINENTIFNYYPANNAGFSAHYIDPCNGTRITGYNNGAVFPFNITFSSVFATTATCN